MALAGVADGMTRTAAAAVGLMDRQTLRDRVHRFNDEGLECLIDRKSTGPKPRLTSEQLATLKAIQQDLIRRLTAWCGGAVLIWPRSSRPALMRNIMRTR